MGKQSRIELTNDRNTIYSKCLLSVISVKHRKESSKAYITQSFLMLELNYSRKIKIYNT